MWFFENDYINKNYTIPKLRTNNFMIPVMQYDINDNFIKYFDTIIQAGKELKIKNSYIKYAMDGKYKSAGGFHWKTVVDNEININQILKAKSVA